MRIRHPKGQTLKEIPMCYYWGCGWGKGVPRTRKEGVLFCEKKTTRLCFLFIPIFLLFSFSASTILLFTNQKKALYSIPPSRLGCASRLYLLLFFLCPALAYPIPFFINSSSENRRETGSILRSGRTRLGMLFFILAALGSPLWRMGAPFGLCLFLFLFYFYRVRWN